MNFILDANIPYSAKTVFHKSDLVEHVRDVRLVDASDDDIIRWAVANDAIIVTRDLDFANIVAHPIHRTPEQSFSEYRLISPRWT